MHRGITAEKMNTPKVVRFESLYIILIGGEEEECRLVKENTHTHIHIMHIYIYAQYIACVYNVSAYMYVYMHVHTYMCVYAWPCAHVCVHVHIY